MFNNSTFDPRQQNRLFETHGERVTYFPGRRCSCASENDSNRAMPNCRSCRGLGYFYRTSRVLFGLVTQIETNKQLMATGLALAGDLVFSQRMGEPLKNTMSDMDMIRLDRWQQGQPYEGELVTRNETTTDSLIYAAVNVLDCYQVDPATGVVTTYVEGPDFTHAPNSADIVWLGGTNQPATNSTYGVKYMAIFDWLAFNPPSQRFERGTPLGNRVILRKKAIVLAALNR